MIWGENVEQQEFLAKKKIWQKLSSGRILFGQVVGRVLQVVVSRWQVAQSTLTRHSALVTADSVAGMRYNRDDVSQKYELLEM